MIKNQNDLIFCIASVVVGLGLVVTFFFMKPAPISYPPPAPVNLDAPTLPPANLTYSTSLPGGGGGGAAMGGMGFAGRPGGGGPPGMSLGRPGGGAPGGMGAPGVPGGKRMPGAAGAGTMGR